MDAFITALYNLASKCDYGRLNDELIRDRIVVGIRNQSNSDTGEGSCKEAATTAKRWRQERS